MKAEKCPRILSHADINSAYASITCLEDRSLRGKRVAIGGDPKSRHGMLSASPEAKKFGVKTGQPLLCEALHKRGGGGRNPAGLLFEERECLTSWDVQCRRIHDESGVWPTLYGGEGGGHGYVAAFSAGQGAKAGGIGFSENLSPTLKAVPSGTNMTPSVLCLNDQGGQRMDVSEDQVGTLRSQMEGHPPLVMATQQGGAEICEDLCPTITASAGLSGNNGPVLFDSHGIDSRYTGPHDVAPTISAYWGLGGNNTSLVVDAPEPETYAIAGNIIGRKEKNGGNGMGFQRDISYTVTATDRHPVIVLAAGGDVDAINVVLKHYEGYIAVLSTRQLYDEYGNPHLCVDEELRRRLETKLITKILTFNAA